MPSGQIEDVSSAARSYPIVNSLCEQGRLERQGREWAAIAERLLRDAGIAPGMRVLDYGCGVGDFSHAAAVIVGERGSVIGVDRDPIQVERARSANTASHVSFCIGDFTSRFDASGFDAVIGRFVLMYQSDPAGALAAACENLRPNGLCVFQEPIIAPELAQLLAWPPPPPEIQRILAASLKALDAIVAHPRLGLQLAEVFAGAALDLRRAHFEAVAPVNMAEAIQDGFAESWSQMARLAVEHGFLAAEDIAWSSLRAYAARTAPTALRMSAPLSVAGWAHKSSKV